MFVADYKRIAIRFVYILMRLYLQSCSFISIALFIGFFNELLHLFDLFIESLLRFFFCIRSINLLFLNFLLIVLQDFGLSYYNHYFEQISFLLTH